MADVHLVVRSLSADDPAKAAALESHVGAGAVLVQADLHDSDSLAVATRDIDVVISAVQGGRGT